MFLRAARKLLYLPPSLGVPIENVRLNVKEDTSRKPAAKKVAKCKIQAGPRLVAGLPSRAKEGTMTMTVLSYSKRFPGVGSVLTQLGHAFKARTCWLHVQSLGSMLGGFADTPSFRQEQKGVQGWALLCRNSRQSISGMNPQNWVALRTPDKIVVPQARNGFNPSQKKISNTRRQKAALWTTNRKPKQKTVGIRTLRTPKLCPYHLPSTWSLQWGWAGPGPERKALLGAQWQLQSLEAFSWLWLS